MTACVVLNPKQEFDIGGVAPRAQHQHQQHKQGGGGRGATPSGDDQQQQRGSSGGSGNKRFAPSSFKIIIPVVARGASGPVSDAEVEVEAPTSQPDDGARAAGARGGGAGGAATTAANGRSAFSAEAGAAGAAAGAAGEGPASGASETAAGGKLAADAEALDGVAPLRRTKSILKRSGDTGGGAGNGSSGGGGGGGALANGGRGPSGELPPSRTVSWRDEGELALDLEIVREFERR